jgi:hypothetical protein
MRSVFRFPGGEFHPNVQLGRDIRQQGIMDDELRRLADLVTLGAKEIAVRSAFDEGDYYRSIHGGLGRNRKGLVVGRTSADDFKADWIERGHRIVTRDGRMVGTVKGKNVLARAARRAGLRVRGRRRASTE